MTTSIPFIDLAAQQEHIVPQIEAAIAKVLAQGRYILGPEVAELVVDTAANDIDACLDQLAAYVAENFRRNGG